MYFHRTTLVWPYLAALSCGLPPLSFPDHNLEIRASLPLPPSQDPFYTVPAGFESAPPGTVLRQRTAPGNLSMVAGNCSSAYNIIYRTTDSHYRPTWALTTLYVPSQPASSNVSLGNALLTYLWPYNSVDVDSSPSYTFYSGMSPDVSQALARGWFVNVPDYEGPYAANAAGILEAHSTLDSIRAVSSSAYGLASDAHRALWGYSGGSIAAEWALEFQEQYAPELQLSGAALGGLVPNVTAVYETVQGTVWASHSIAGLLGMLSQYTNAYSFLLSQLITSGPYNKTTFLSIKHMSFAQGHVEFSGQNVLNDYFVHGPEILQAPVIKSVLDKEAIMTYHGVPRVPLFIYKAIHDEVTLVADSDAYVERNCLLGANILYERNRIGGHEDEFTNGDARAFAWLADVFDGSYATKYQTFGCTIRNVTVDLTDTGT